MNFSPDGTRLLTGSAGFEGITLWDLATQLKLIKLEGKEALYSEGKFSPDGNVLAANDAFGGLYLWRAPSWDEIGEAERRMGGKTQ